MFKLTLMIALIAFGISKYNEKYNCTDDGCPDFHEIEIPLPDEDVRGDLREIEKDWKKAVVVAYNPIHLEYGVHKIVQKTYSLPEIDTSSNENFVQSLNTCINFLYQSIEPEFRIPNELIIAQAVIETGWGKSRFANEGNNLFGIRTWKKDMPHLLPQGVEKWPGWGVKVFASKCDSVKYYVELLNNHSAYEEFRELRKTTNDSMKLIKTLDKFSTTADYDKRVARMILRIRKLEEEK